MKNNFNFILKAIFVIFVLKIFKFLDILLTDQLLTDQITS